MSAVKSRREEYAQNTREALVRSGAALFADRAFAEVSAEELVAAAGLSRGALYHHFGGKQGLFAAVFEDLENTAAERIAAAMSEPAGLREKTIAGMNAFLDICTDHAYRQIVLLQGPLVLGWERWRELDRRSLAGLMVTQTKLLKEQGLTRFSPELVAAMFYGGLTDMSFVLAASPDPAPIRAEAARMLEDLLDSLRPA
ncbi:TetR/AcrR family transcriptional regulator [Nocardia sp. NPDC057668]|uniref:TetR/AcrR family transcriptional regulator n=1 Tax=Nocardia sp. NPDC057668 TaxID=3346202 RepID=UPI003672DE4A